MPDVNHPSPSLSLPHFSYLGPFIITSDGVLLLGGTTSTRSSSSLCFSCSHFIGFSFFFSLRSGFPQLSVCPWIHFWNYGFLEQQPVSPPGFSLRLGSVLLLTCCRRINVDESRPLLPPGKDQSPNSFSFPFLLAPDNWRFLSSSSFFRGGVFDALSVLQNFSYLSFL